MEHWTIALIAILASIFFKIYSYIRANMSHFERMGIPHIKPKFAVGSMGSVLLMRTSSCEHSLWIYNQCPGARYLGFHNFTDPVIMLRDPDLVKQLGIKNFDSMTDHQPVADDEIDPYFAKNLFGLRGNRWRVVRAMLSPAFTSSKLKAMFQLAAECASDFSAHLADVYHSKDLEMKDAFTRYTNDVIATTIFGISVNSVRDRDNEFFLMGREATAFTATRTLMVFAYRAAPRLAKLFGLRIIKKRTGQFFKHVVQSTIAERDAKGISRPDMIQLMMDCRGTESELNIDDTTAQAFIFFFGGFDTTASAMSFAAHLIAVNPSVQEKLQREIDEVRERCNDRVTYESLRDMQYMDAVINETLRMFPPAFFTDRLCTKEYELPPPTPDSKPVTIQPGTSLWIPIFALHYDPNYFPEPSKFNPDRFYEPNGGCGSNFPPAYLPFGLGPRMCIGNRFALMEVKLMLFHLLSLCNVKPCRKTTLPMKISRSSFTTTSENDFWLRIERRT